MSDRDSAGRTTPKPATYPTLRPPDGTYRVWGLWDAGDLVGLHATEQGAQDAREAHLSKIGPSAAEDQELYENATKVIPMILQVP